MVTDSDEKEYEKSLVRYSKYLNNSFKKPKSTSMTSNTGNAKLVISKSKVWTRNSMIRSKSTNRNPWTDHYSNMIQQKHRALNNLSSSDV